MFIFVLFCCIALLAYDYSPSDGTDGLADDAETGQLSAQAANNKPRKKRLLRTSRKKHDKSQPSAWDNAVPRNLSADAVSFIKPCTLYDFCNN